MNTDLHWKERDGIYTSNSQGFSYCIRPKKESIDLYNLYLSFKEGQLLGSGSYQSMRELAQSHHDAIFQAVEEGIIEVDLCVRRHPAFIEMKNALKAHHDWAMDRGDEVTYTSPACDLYQKTVNALTL